MNESQTPYPRFSAPTPTRPQAAEVLKLAFERAAMKIAVIALRRTLQAAVQSLQAGIVICNQIIEVCA